MNAGELIAKLREVPPDTEVLIEDADTNFFLVIMQAEMVTPLESSQGFRPVRQQGAFVLSGDYGNMVEE